MIVMVVIFLFLGSFRSVLIPVVAIPLSLIGGVFLMQLFGFTVNLLTLLAIVLSVGLVVDDAIVVVENVDRHLELGADSGRKAARAAMAQVINPRITSYNVCYTKLLRSAWRSPVGAGRPRWGLPAETSPVQEDDAVVRRLRASVSRSRLRRRASNRGAASVYRRP